MRMQKYFHKNQKKKLPTSSFGKCKKKSGIMKSGLDAMPLLLLDDLLNTPNFK